jgi:HlyD family secretion protein
MSKKKIYILLSVLVAIAVLLVVLKSKGVIGNNDDSKEVEVAKANEITIIETVSATGKILSLIHI